MQIHTQTHTHMPNMPVTSASHGIINAVAVVSLVQLSITAYIYVYSLAQATKMQRKKKRNSKNARVSALHFHHKCTGLLLVRQTAQTYADYSCQYQIGRLHIQHIIQYLRSYISHFHPNILSLRFCVCEPFLFCCLLLLLLSSCFSFPSFWQPRKTSNRLLLSPPPLLSKCIAV